MALKDFVLPRGRRVRRLPLGIARGLRMEIDFAYQTRLFLGLYETELSGHLRTIARPGARSFDVGGQFGYDALVLAKLTRAPVLSIECDASIIEHMQRNFAANPELAPLITPVPGFVGAHSSAESISLDDLAARPEAFVPDVIKIDIEGGELDALRGAESILRDRGPALLIETHSVALDRDCQELLRGHGYTPIVVDQRRFFADSRPGVDLNRWIVAHAR